MNKYKWTAIAVIVALLGFFYIKANWITWFDGDRYARTAEVDTATSARAVTKNIPISSDEWTRVHRERDFIGFARHDQTLSILLRNRTGTIYEIKPLGVGDGRGPDLSDGSWTHWDIKLTPNQRVESTVVTVVQSDIESDIR